MDKLRKIVKEYRGHDDWAEHEYLDGLVGLQAKNWFLSAPLFHVNFEKWTFHRFFLPMDTRSNVQT